jgi:hypothetical protein
MLGAVSGRAQTGSESRSIGLAPVENWLFRCWWRGEVAVPTRDFFHCQLLSILEDVGSQLQSFLEDQSVQIGSRK